jgi:hypothetical protein
MKNTLITRIFKNSDGIQQIAIFDATKKPKDSEQGLFIDELGREHIVPACKHNVGRLAGKLIFIGVKLF